MPYPPSPRTCPYHIGVLEAIHIGDATRCDERSAVRVARRRRTDMVMQASMWVLGVAAVERQLCRSEPTVVRPVRHFLWPTAIRLGHHAFLRGGRPIPPLPASTRRAAGSAHTLPLFLGYRTIPYRAKIRNPAWKGPQSRGGSLQRFSSKGPHSVGHSKRD